MVKIPENKIDIDDQPLCFGKHEGRTPNELFEQEEYSYLAWLGENITDPPCMSEDLYDCARAEILDEDQGGYEW